MPINVTVERERERHELFLFPLDTFPGLPVTNEGSPWRNRSSGRGKDRQPTEDIMGNLAGKKEKMGVVSNPITRGK